MDKIFTYNQHSPQKSSIESRCTNRTDIEEFDYVLEKKVEKRNVNDNDENTLEVESLTPYGAVTTEFVVEREKEDQKITISSLPVDAVTCIDNDSNCSNRGDSIYRANNVHSIRELVKIVDNLLFNGVCNKDNKWKFTYMDSSIGRLNMSVNKVSQNHISVIISSPHINKIDLRRISQQLQSRLSHKGWGSQISQASDVLVKNNTKNK